MEIRTDVLGPIGGEILGVAEDNVEGPLPDVDVDFDGDVQDKWPNDFEVLGLPGCTIACWSWNIVLEEGEDKGDLMVMHPCKLILKYLD
jgi:hypothetical protein